jgi:hypothetical protein
MLNLIAVLQDAANAAAAGKDTYSAMGAGLGLRPRDHRRRHRPRPHRWPGRRGDRPPARAAGEIRGAALLIAVLLEGATIISLVFALLFKLL